jgi:O-antigen/teichoic acid export membrane protein
MGLVVAVAVPACILGLVLAPYVMGLVYGSEFIEGTGALRWMAIACLFAAISGHFRFGLLASGRQSREMMSSAAGAATTIVLLPAGYFIGGITFAALGLCFAEVVILIVSWLQSRQLLETDDRPIIDTAAYSAGVTSKPQSAR